MCKIPHQQRKYMYMYARELTNDDTRLSYRYIFLSHNQTLGQKKTYAFLILFIYLFIFLCQCVYFLCFLLSYMFIVMQQCVLIYRKPTDVFPSDPGLTMELRMFSTCRREPEQHGLKRWI